MHSKLFVDLGSREIEMTKVLKSKYKSIFNIGKEEPTQRKKKKPPLGHVKKSDWRIVWTINMENSLLLVINGAD